MEDWRCNAITRDRLSGNTPATINNADLYVARHDVCNPQSPVERPHSPPSEPPCESSSLRRMYKLPYS